MNCPRCGFEQHIGATFCPNCGWLLTGGENPDDFWRIENPVAPSLRKPPKRRRRKDRRSQEQAQAQAPEEPEATHDQPTESVTSNMPLVVEDQKPAVEAHILEETSPSPVGAPVTVDAAPTDLPPQSPVSATTPQAPAIPRGEAFVLKPPTEKGLSRFVWPALALILGFLLGAVAMYTLSPPKEYIVLDPLPTPSPRVEPRPIGGLLPIPVPQTSPGPIPAPGPDLSTQNDLRNALIAEKQHYARAGQYTADIDALQKEAPHVVWEPGVTPSRPGVVAVMVCGGPDPSAPLLLQALGPTGRYYGIYDVPSGPASAVYYGMSQQSFNCPNSSPPQIPWMSTLAGWGQQQPTVTEQAPGRAGPEPSPPSDQEILGGTPPPPSTPGPTGPRPTPTPLPPPSIG
jgi:uncharacterized Zn finger protein (UPF0148 family)